MPCNRTLLFAGHLSSTDINCASNTPQWKTDTHTSLGLAWSSCCSLFGLWVVPTSLWPHGLQHARLPCPSLSPRVCSNTCPLSWWYYLTISSFAALFSFCLQSFPAAGSFPMSQPFTSGGQSIRASASASILPMNIQGWLPLEWTGLISLLSKRLSRVFSSTIGKHEFFGAQPSLWSSSHIYTCLLEKK